MRISNLRTVKRTMKITVACAVAVAHLEAAHANDLIYESTPFFNQPKGATPCRP